MKFLTKNPQSDVLTEGHRYRTGKDNSKLKSMLLEEQFSFCAYTESYCTKIDQYHIEHFVAAADGGGDDYFNLYAVTPWANHKKIGKLYSGTTFFQSEAAFRSRIRYEDGIYCSVNKEDIEAKSLIDYLGFNHPDLQFERNEHVESLRDIFARNNWTPSQIQEYLFKHPKYLSFPTAIEAEFGIDLTEIIRNLA